MSDSRLPDGWSVEGLWHEGDKTLEHNVDPTDFEIVTADAIVVKLEDDMGIDYRTIHGALDWDSIYDLIEELIENDSPVR